LVASVPLALKVSSTRPSQSLSTPSQSSVQPPGRVLQLALTAEQVVALGPLQTRVPLVRQAPWPGKGRPASLTQG